jgi:hypothetical protein
MGVVPIDKTFTGVADIRKKNEETVEIVGHGGERIDVSCGVDFIL